LQAGDVEVEGEVSVSYSHGAVGVERMNLNVVAGDEGVTVDAGVTSLLRRCERWDA
jgi:hypothetical protein